MIESGPEDVDRSNDKERLCLRIHMGDGGSLPQSGDDAMVKVLEAMQIIISYFKSQVSCFTSRDVGTGSG